MNIWILTLWVVFKPIDGGITVKAEIERPAGTNRATCEYFGKRISKEMMLHGIPEINEKGEEVILYPAEVRGRCELEKQNDT